MKKLSTLAMVASVAMMPLAANAAPEDGTYTGQVQVFKGISLTCNLTADVQGGGTVATNIALSPTSFLTLLCSSVSFNYQPYAVAHLGGSTYELQGVNVTTITPGDCEGNISVTYNAGPPPSITLAGSLPASSGGGDCTIHGTITKVS